MDLIHSEEVRRRARSHSRLVPASGLTSTWVHDLPVCFTGHPCVDYSPFEADAINITSALTPASTAIAAGCFVALGLAVVLVAFEVLPRTPRLRLRLVALLTALVLIGAVVGVAADLRLDAISVIFGLEGPGSPDLYGSWLLVEQAGGAMMIIGVVGLVLTATLGLIRLDDLLRARDPKTR